MAYNGDLPCVGSAISLRSFRRVFLLAFLASTCTLMSTAHGANIKAGRLRVDVDRFINYPPASDLLFPVFMAAPDDGTNRLFFLEKGVEFFPTPQNPPLGFSARIRMYNNGALSTFLDLSAEISPQSESGLLGMAFHPGFANPVSPGYRKLYTFHSAYVNVNADVDFPAEGMPVHHHNVLTEWQVSAGNPNVVDVSTRRELFRAEHPSDIHNSGTITFGPDGYLYGSIGTPPIGQNSLLAAQDNSDILGSIYRIDPLAPSATPGSTNPISTNGKYRIPADNPFVSDPLALDEIYAYGLRNAYRFSVDPVSGLLFAGDVGESWYEELNVIPKGGNMGWPYREGTINGPVPSPPVPPNMVAPLFQYDHSDGTAVVGGYVYRGSIEALHGKYIFGDFSTDFFSGHGRLFASDVFDENGELKSPGEIEVQEILLSSDSCNEEFRQHCSFDVPLTSFGIDAEGELYMVGFDPSQAVIYRITDAVLLPAGDYNEDGTVDAIDYTIWRDSVGDEVAAGTKADGDGDGVIGQGDFAVWKSHFGESIALGSASDSLMTVPEPHSFLLMFQVLIVVVTSFRQRALDVAIGA